MRSFVVGLVLAASVGCGKDATQPIAPTSVRVALSFVAGDGQVDTVGRILKTSIVAETTDSTNKATAVPSVVLNWYRIAGKDTVFAGASITDGAGRAKFQWTLLSRAGSQSVIAWALDPAEGAPVTHVEAQAVALPDRPAVVHMKASYAINAWLGDTIRARSMVQDVVDRFGNGVTDAKLTIQTLPSGEWTMLGDTAAVAGRIGASTVTVVSDTARAQTTAQVLRDLRKMIGWSMSWSCGDTTLNLPYRDLDYKTSTGVVDSVQSFPSASGHEWILWVKATVRQHSDGQQRWDTLTTTERVLVQKQASNGTLTVPYLITSGVRMDLDGTPTAWSQEQGIYAGGNVCLGTWQTTEPFTALTLQPPKG